MTPEEAARLTEICFPEGPWRASEIRAFLDLDTTRFFFRDAGFLMAQFVPPEADIQLLAVAPEARCQGVGTSLLCDLIAQAIGEGVTEIFLDVTATNDAAVMLYRRAGFEVVGTRKDYYPGAEGRRVDALLMRKAVPRS